jgi:hypothetical protein
MPPNAGHLRQMEVFEALMRQPGSMSVPEHGAKLARTKQRWAEEGKGLTGETASPATRRLPPGQHEVWDFPVVDLGTRPHVATGRCEKKVHSTKHAKRRDRQIGFGTLGAFGRVGRWMRQRRSHIWEFCWRFLNGRWCLGAVERSDYRGFAAGRRRYFVAVRHDRFATFEFNH